MTKQIAVDTNADGTTTDNQETRYVYSDELTDKASPIVRNDLLRGVIYPDSDDTVTSNALTGTDHISYTYYANGARKTITDQRGQFRGQFLNY